MHYLKKGYSSITACGIYQPTNNTPSSYYTFCGNCCRTHAFQNAEERRYAKVLKIVENMDMAFLISREFLMLNKHQRGIPLKGLVVGKKIDRVQSVRIYTLCLSPIIYRNRLVVDHIWLRVPKDVFTKATVDDVIFFHGFVKVYTKPFEESSIKQRFGFNPNVHTIEIQNGLNIKESMLVQAFDIAKKNPQK